MPTYTPLGTNIKLVACSLADATATHPSRQKQEAAPATKHAEGVISNAAALSEKHIPCLGETTRLHFLDNVPFYLIQAGADLFKPKESSMADRAKAIIEEREHSNEELPEKTGKSRGRTSRAPSVAPDAHVPDAPVSLRSQSSATTSGRRRSGLADVTAMPQALGLVITLSRNTFLEDWDRGRQKTSRKGARQHVRFDVFLNGDLVKSDCQPSRYWSRDSNGQPTLDSGNIRIVSGKRVAMLCERAWVIIPPEQTAAATLREAKRTKAAMAGAEERWEAIGEALLKRADEQGYDANEERSPLGQYLANLAAMEMPESVADMQKQGGHKFGVIDVVISVGQGAKGQLSAHYLHDAEYLVDTKYKRMPDGWRPRRSQQSTTTQVGLASGSSEADTSLKRSNSIIGKDKNQGSRMKAMSPTTIQDAASHASQPSIFGSDSMAQSGYVRILPKFPPVPEIDYNDLVSITPTKAETLRMARGVQSSDPISDNSKYLESASESPMSMPPPPVPGMHRLGKRRRADAISVTDNESPSKRPHTPARPGATSGSKSVSGFMGMTKRGLFNKGRRTRRGSSTAQPVSTPTQPTSDATPPQLPEDSITRVVITGKETPVIDRTLVVPYDLRQKSRIFQTAEQSSPKYQPLDESVVFGLRSLKVKSTPCTSQQVSSDPPAPTSDQPLPPQACPTSKLQPTPPAPEPAPAAHIKPPTPKPKYDDPLEGTRATWQTPPLSEDCVISFAEEGDWISNAGRGSVLRQVRSERAGTFTTSEVVFAVRYIVAGERGFSI